MELSLLMTLFVTSLFFVILKYSYFNIVRKYRPNMKGQKGWTILKKNTPTQNPIYDLKKDSQFPTTLQQVITHQPTLPTFLPVPNKRGEKPLSIIPSTKKHLQNLDNQRAFRRRRENYIYTLEAKARTFQLLYAEAQNEVKFLHERLTLLERKLAQRHQNAQSIDASGGITNNGTYGGIPSFSFNDQPLEDLGEPIPNRRTTMPSTEKHIMNLAYHKRQRREKAKACEILCAEAQNEIKMLRERLEGKFYAPEKSYTLPENQTLSASTPSSFSFNDQQQITSGNSVTPNITTCNDSSQTSHEQPMLAACSLVPNKHGRKPLQTIPLHVSHSYEFTEQWRLQQEEGCFSQQLPITTTEPMDLE